jgi:hypothetical protein
MVSIVAPLNYLAPPREPIRTYAYDPPDGGPRFNGVLEVHPSEIRNARQLGAPLSLFEQGFTCVPHRSEVLDFWDEDALRRTHYAEAEALVMELTGARSARVFDHTLRRRAPGRPPLDGTGGSFATVREPVGRVHADYTPFSGPERLRLALGDETETARRLQQRYLILGLWRSLNPTPLLDAPLALADTRSVSLSDLVPNDLIYRERRGQTYTVLHSPEHDWYYYPQLTRDEVLVFMHYDSARATQPCTGASPHTAFEDPTTPATADPRQSLELRVLVFLED